MCKTCYPLKYTEAYRTFIGPFYRYFHNLSKTCIIVKENLYDAMITAFQGTGVTDGKRHLGTALGSPTLVLPVLRHR